jgi:hypothetical protein
MPAGAGLDLDPAFMYNQIPYPFSRGNLCTAILQQHMV